MDGQVLWCSRKYLIEVLGSMWILWLKTWWWDSICSKPSHLHWSFPSSRDRRHAIMCNHVYKNPSPWSLCSRSSSPDLKGRVATEFCSDCKCNELYSHDIIEMNSIYFMFSFQAWPCVSPAFEVSKPFTCMLLKDMDENFFFVLI